MRPNPHLKLHELSIGGLDPGAWIVVDQGVNREEVKEFFLSRGVGFSGPAILDVAGFCRQILGVMVSPQKVLSPSARQEVLRKLLSDSPRIATLPELRRLKRQKSFYKKLDRSIQSARLTYASAPERDAQEERLLQSSSLSPIREEVKRVIADYEVWLQVNHAWDTPRMVLASLAAVSAWDVELSIPPKICVLSPHRGESRIEAFWEALGRRVEVERIVLSELELKIEEMAGEITKRVEWEEWHTIDDAVERLADALHVEALAGRLNENGVLMPDLPVVRRSVLRALRERGILLKDPRDPTRLRWEESVKAAMLPLDLVARRFTQEDVLSLLHSGWIEFSEEERRTLHQDVQDRGIRQGLSSYEGGRLGKLHTILSGFAQAFPPRLRVAEVAAIHLQILKDNPNTPIWICEFFESAWTKFQADMLVIEEIGRKAPLLYWCERMRMRIDESTPPVERVQWKGGIELFRLGQVPLVYPEKLWCLALPARWTTSEVGGDYWLSEREREILSGHFLVRSGVQDSLDRRRILLGWCLHASEVKFLDATYDWDGRERETIDPLLKELGFRVKKQVQGSHPRWRSGYLNPKTHPPREISLPRLEKNEISASDIERFSRCEFQGLAQGRWKLREAKPSDLEIRGDARGILLHEAVRILIEARDAEGNFSISCEAAIDQAWELKRPKGLLQSKRLQAYTKRRLIPVLESFCEGERKYAQTSGAKVLSLEGPELRYSVAGVTIKGIPDRIDEHPDGLVLMDYKTGGDSPQASQMIEQGYRLQLPIYALAARNTFGKVPAALTFIELKRKGSRARGLFFKQLSGKEPGKIANPRSNSKSLVTTGIEETWGELAQQIETHVEKYLSGQVFVKPKAISEKDPYKECESCFVRDLCGQRRFMDTAEGEEGDE